MCAQARSWGDCLYLQLSRQSLDGAVLASVHHTVTCNDARQGRLGARHCSLRKGQLLCMHLQVRLELPMDREEIEECRVRLGTLQSL